MKPIFWPFAALILLLFATGCPDYSALREMPDYSKMTDSGGEVDVPSDQVAAASPKVEPKSDPSTNTASTSPATNRPVVSRRSKTDWTSWLMYGGILAAVPVIAFVLLKWTPIFRKDGSTDRQPDSNKATTTKPAPKIVRPSAPASDNAPASDATAMTAQLTPAPASGSTQSEETDSLSAVGHLDASKVSLHSSDNFSIDDDDDDDFDLSGDGDLELGFEDDFELNTESEEVSEEVVSNIANAFELAVDDVQSTELENQLAKLTSENQRLTEKVEQLREQRNAASAKLAEKIAQLDEIEQSKTPVPFDQLSSMSQEALVEALRSARLNEILLAKRIEQTSSLNQRLRKKLRQKMDLIRKVASKDK